MRKVLIGLLLTLVVAAAAIKGYLWYQVKQGADALTTAMAPVARISYGRIKAGLDGNIGVRDVRIDLRGFGVPIRIGSITLHGSGLWGLVRAQRDLSEGRAPRALDVTISHIEVDSATATMRRILNRAGSFGFTSCAEGEPIEVKDWRAMGYRRLDADVDFSYAFNKADTSLSLYLYARDRKLASVDLALTLPLSRYDLAPAYFGAIHPKVSAATLRYEDRGFNGRMLHLCATRLGTSPDEAVRRRMQALKAANTSLGFELTGAFYKAYAHYLHQPGDIVVRLQPAQPVRVDALRFYTPDAGLRMLGASLFIDGVKVNAIAAGNQLAPTAPKAAAKKPDVSRKASTTPPPAAAAPNPASSAGPTANPPRFHDTKVADLAGYVGDPVIITTLDGRRFDGVLTGIGDGSLVLRRDVAGGDMSFRILKSGVQSVRVYH